MIRKEVFDMADTMDVMAQVMHYHGDKVALIHEGLNMAGRENQDIVEQDILN